MTTSSANKGAFDVVVIGSGAGGAPLAWKLAESGMKVLVLERGRALRREDFDRDEVEWCRRDRFIPSPVTDPHTRRMRGDETAMRTADGWISTVLGGGTVHMAGYLLRADPKDALQGTRCAHEPGSEALDWAVPYDDVARYYDQAEIDLGVAGAPTDKSPGLRTHALALKLDKAAHDLGLPTMPTPRGILTEARPDDDRGACDYRLQCASYGCPTDARASMPVTYLRRAARSGNVTVWTHALALRIERAAAAPSGSGARAEGVVVRHLVDGREELVRCGTVVVACGAIESARLLLLSGDGFNPQGQVGRHLWFSLCTEVSGFFEREKHKDVVDLMAGPTFLNRTVHHGGHLDEQTRNKTGLDRIGMFECSFVHDNPIHRAERVATEGRLVYGRALKEELLRQFRRGRTVMLEGFAESLPHAGASIDLDPDVRDQHGLPVARITHVHHDRDVRVSALQGKEGTELLRAMGAVDVHVTRGPSETLVLQGGTCRFGNDPSTSVIDPDGAMHAMRNVYVADGGALPSSLAVPATLTIIANSLRTADRILARGM